jgi:hypothetical protein
MTNISTQRECYENIEQIYHIVTQAFGRENEAILVNRIDQSYF